jgi:hypothetical protein
LYINAGFGGDVVEEVERDAANCGQRPYARVEFSAICAGSCVRTVSFA